MQTLDCIKTRRSIRAFKKDTVSKKTIEQILDAAIMAPSWKNTQICRYTIISDRTKIDYLADNCMMDFTFNQNTLHGAPHLAVISMVEKRCGYERDGSFSTSKEDRWEMFDAGIAAQTFCLAGHDLGIGSVILGIFDEKKVAEAIALPGGQKIAALIAFGYAEGEVVAPKRKCVEDVSIFL